MRRIGLLRALACVATLTALRPNRHDWRWGLGILATIMVVLPSVGVAGAASSLNWSPPIVIDGSALSSVSCDSSSFCVAVDYGGNALTWNGGTWSAPVNIDGGTQLTSVSCAASSFCAAVDNSGNALIWALGKWSAPVNVVGTTLITAVSCPDSSFCVAVANGSAATWNGTSWSAPVIVDPSNYLTSVSCIASHVCVAVDANGNAVRRHNAGLWSAPENIDGTNNLESVSCTTSNRCAAVDQMGNALTWDGLSWSAPDHVDGSNNLYRVSCVGSNFCAAVDTSGNVLTWDGTAWSAASNIAGTAELSSVSCSSSLFCAAVDYQGSALTYVGNGPPPAPIWRTAVMGGDGAMWVLRADGTFAGYGGVLMGAPAVVVVPGSPTVTYYVVTGGDHRLWVRTDTTGWQLFSGGSYCFDNPAALWDAAAGELIVACAGGDHALWVTRLPLTAGGAAYSDAFVSLGGYLAYGPAMTVVNGVVDFIVTGRDPRVWERTFSQDFHGTPWLCIGHPAAGYSGGVAYFGCHGTDGALWVTRNWGSGWEGTHSAGGQLIDGPGVAASAGGTEFSVEGTDRALWQTTLDANGYPTGFSGRGGILAGGAGAGGG
ncbi:MAG: hypothetical protein NVSMB29_12430 [Candidatus Dormibacteria bacterium]